MKDAAPSPGPHEESAGTLLVVLCNVTHQCGYPGGVRRELPIVSETSSAQPPLPAATCYDCQSVCLSVSVLFLLTLFCRDTAAWLAL